MCRHGSSRSAGAKGRCVSKTGLQIVSQLNWAAKFVGECFRGDDAAFNPNLKSCSGTCQSKYLIYKLKEASILGATSCIIFLKSSNLSLISIHPDAGGSRSILLLVAVYHAPLGQSPSETQVCCDEDGQDTLEIALQRKRSTAKIR